MRVSQEREVMFPDEMGILLWGGCFIHVASFLPGTGGKGEDCET